MDYKTRRTRVMETMPQGSLALFFSGKAPVRSLDEAYPFSVNRNFYYLTGLDRESMTLALIKNGDYVQSVLFIEPFDPEQARWVGGRMKPEEAQQQADVDAVYPNADSVSSIRRSDNCHRSCSAFCESASNPSRASICRLSMQNRCSESSIDDAP